MAVLDSGVTSSGKRHRRDSVAAIVATSDVAGGAESYLTRLYGHPLILENFAPAVIGDLVGASEAGIPSYSARAGRKWGRRTAVTSLVSLPGVHARGVRLIRGIDRARSVRFFHMQYKREQVLFTVEASRHAPVLWTEHGRLPRVPGWRLLTSAYRRAGRKASGIVCVSEAVADDLDVLFRGRGPRLHVIENAIDPDWLSPAAPAEKREARERLGVGARGQTLAVAVCRLSAGKRIDLLVRTAESTNDLTAVISGDGPELPRLKSLASQANTIFTGYLEDPRDVYRAADVVVLPTDGSGEGLPFGLLEAAAAGLPAIVVADSNLGSCVEGWGCVASSPTVDAVREAISVAVGRSSTATSRAWAEAHSPGEWARRHLEIMESL